MEEMKKDEVLEEQQMTAEAAEAAEAEAVQAEEIPDAVDETAEKIAKLEQQAADNLDKYQRTLAEFDNFRKRTDKEKTAMFETGAKSVIEKILPVVDNFERGLATIPEEEKGTPFAEGMEMIYRQLMTELDKMEVKVIPAVGEEFDPALHNAVMQVESDEYESGVIAQELLKGYTYRDAVVRHSMVAVVA